jgi:peptide-methionine (S)-S-oxide reductase
MSEKALFAAGCFWGVEEAFRTLDGVLSTRVGYTAGHTNNPTYKDVCTDTTGHAEALLVEYDPKRISYEDLLDQFWSIHNPTTLNQQGPDIGSQYRSGIYFFTPQQEATAKNAMALLEKGGKYPRPIVTEILPAEPFYEAEEYHQQYALKHGRHCNL